MNNEYTLTYKSKTYLSHKRGQRKVELCWKAKIPTMKQGFIACMYLMQGVKRVWCLAWRRP